MKGMNEISLNGDFCWNVWLGFLTRGLRGEFEQDRFGWNDLNEKVRMERFFKITLGDFLGDFSVELFRLYI